LWTNGTMTNLGLLGSATASYGYGINDGTSGGVKVCGALYCSNGRFGCVFTGVNTGLTLNALTPPMGSYPWREAYDINNSNVVVGSSLYSDGKYHAVTWAAGSSTITDISGAGGAGWVLNTANAINDNGWIVGTGTHNNHSRAYMLQP